MLIWILVLVLFAVAGACGYKLGAVRFGVSLAGMILAVILAVPVGVMLMPLAAWAGLTNPAWIVVLPPIVAFLVIYSIFIGLSFFVHRKVDLHFKYHADDRQRFGWERVNRSVGLWLGLVTGAAWLFLIALFIYPAGYLAVQVTTDDTQSLQLRLLSQSRQDMQSTGLDKAIVPFDPMPARYYDAADIIGLVYQNPILINRLSQYPPFLLLGEREEIQELSKDADFNQMLLSKADFMQIINHPRLQAILRNPLILMELVGQDLQDLRTYLETGISPKYEDEKILGRWMLDPYASMAQERRRRPDMSSSDMRRLRTIMTDILSSVSLTATTDNKVVVKADGVDEKLRQFLQPTPSQPAAPAPDATPGISAQMAERYGRGRGAQQPRVAVAPPAAAAPKKVEAPYVILSAQGSWERTGDRYALKGQDERGTSFNLEASADDERLMLYGPNAVLVFAKAG